MKIFNKGFGTRDMVLVSMFIALTIVLERSLSIQTPIVRIGFAFIPIASMAMLYGPVVGGVGAAIADFIGINLFPVGGGFFPGFTLTAFLTGVVYGIFLHNRKKSFINISIAVVIVTFLLNLGLDTFWLYMTMNMGVASLIPSRAIKALVMTPVQIATISLIWNQIFCRLPFSIKSSLSINCER